MIRLRNVSRADHRFPLFVGVHRHTPPLDLDVTVVFNESRRVTASMPYPPPKDWVDRVIATLQSDKENIEWAIEHGFALGPEIILLAAVRAGGSDSTEKRDAKDN